MHESENKHENTTYAAINTLTHGDGNDDGGVLWCRTKRACDRLKGSSEYERPRDPSLHSSQYASVDAPYGYFSDRPVIGSDTVNIIGGVYLGGSSREAIVVDDTRDNPADKYLRDIYSAFILRPMNYMCSYGMTDRKFLQLVYEATLLIMPYNQWMVEEIIGCYAVNNDRKIHLAVFASERAAVCRHMALLAAYFITRYSLQPNPAYKPNSRVRVMRNQVEGIGGGAHAWVQYESGESWILDPAQKMLGKIEEIQQRGCCWVYTNHE